MQDREAGSGLRGEPKVARLDSEIANPGDADLLDPDAEDVVSSDVDTSSLVGVGSGGANLATEMTDSTSYSAQSNKQAVAASDGTGVSNILRGSAGASGLDTADRDSVALAANTSRTSTIGSRSSSRDSSSSTHEALNAWDDQSVGSRNASSRLGAADALVASDAADALEDSTFGGAAAGALPGGGSHDSMDGGAAGAGGRGHGSAATGQSAAAHSSAGMAPGVATGRKGPVDEAKAAGGQLATSSGGSSRSKSAERAGTANAGAGGLNEGVNRSQGNLASGTDSVSVTARSADDSDRVSKPRAKSGSFDGSSSSDVGSVAVDSTDGAAESGTSLASGVKRSNIRRNRIYDSNGSGSSGLSAGESGAQPDGRADLEDGLHGPKGSRGTATSSSGAGGSRGGSRAGSSSKKGTSSAAVKSVGHLEAQPLSDDPSGALRAARGGDGSKTGTTAAGKPAARSDEKLDGLAVGPSANGRANELQLNNYRCHTPPDPS